MTQPLGQDQQDAYQLLQATLQEWGLETLASSVYDFVVQGYSQEAIGVLLRDTDAYRQRFAGNELRKRAGLPVLSPAEYLSVERSYRSLLRSAGIPEGFWDTASDFTQLISKDVSPMELQRRVDVAQNIAGRLDQNTHAWFRDQYGLDFNNLDRGVLTAYVLDADRGMDAINRVLKGGRIAGAAAGRGVGLSREQAEAFGQAADLNNLDRQALEFAQLAQRGSFLSGVHGGDYDVQRAGEDVFMGSSAAEQERIRLQKLELAEFSGAGGTVGSSLGQSSGSY